MAQTFIPADALARLVAEAKTSASHEICGLLFGALDSIDVVRATANIADDPSRTFEIDPAALLSAYRSARQDGPPVIGHYHSHPSGSAVPSECDRAAAEPGKLWLILAGDEARLWLADQNGFIERQLCVHHNC